jgi:HEAT repeat protein
VPSLLVHKDFLYGVQDAGVATCWQCDSGKEVWKERLSGTFSASPVLVGALIYATNEAGRTFIFKASPAGFEPIADNQLGAEVLASPAICGGRIYMRIAVQSQGQREELLCCLGTPEQPATRANWQQGIRNDLKSTAVEVRRAALRSLVHSEFSAPLRQEIQAALKDDDAEVRATAATAIGNLGAAAAPAVPLLVAQLQHDSSKEARETAARALGRIGKAAPRQREALPPLRQASVQDMDPVTRVVALGALAMMEDAVPEQVTRLRKYLSHGDELVRMKAAHALGMIGPAAKAAAPEIISVLQRATDAHHRGYIARALGNTGDPASLPVLYQALDQETDNGARGEMRGAISRLGGKVPMK